MSTPTCPACTGQTHRGQRSLPEHEREQGCPKPQATHVPLHKQLPSSAVPPRVRATPGCLAACSGTPRLASARLSVCFRCAQRWRGPFYPLNLLPAARQRGRTGRCGACLTPRPGDAPAPALQRRSSRISRRAAQRLTAPTRRQLPHEANRPPATTCGGDAVSRTRTLRSSASARTRCRTSARPASA